jgi:UDP-glucose 4-epimerase
MKYSKVLVTGGAGFIGSHIVDRLLKEGYEVNVIDDLSYGFMENLASYKANKSFHFIRGDIRDFGDVKKAVEDVDVVFHEAGLVGIILSVENPFLTHEINVTGTLNLLKAASEVGVKRFVYASSAAVYGYPSVPRKEENMPLDPTTSPYAVSKLAAENYAMVFNELYGLETVSLRYFNVYGPRQRVDITTAYGSVVLLFLSRLLKNMAPLIFGDGGQTRDFVYVQDVVEANMLVMNSRNAVGEVFNVGTGVEVSVNEVAKILKELLNKTELQDVHAAPRPPDVRRGFADIQKAEKLLGYSPRFSLREGIADLIKQYSA